MGNVGRHQVIPVPFNQPNIASPSNPALSGRRMPAELQLRIQRRLRQPALTLPDRALRYLANYEGGNVDLRVPYIGYAAESITYKAAGVDAYNALQAHIDKRMSHGIQVGASYTWSHALDEQSGLGLFYNGNNPLNLRSGYGSSDFDRTHVINFNYVFQIPDFANEEFPGRQDSSTVGRWSASTVLQSGQPYSIIDFSGAIGSIYYSTADGITNPIVPLATGCTAKSAMTGASGAWIPAGGSRRLNAACFTLPLLPAGGLGGAIPASDPYETGFTTGQRNIFRQAFQKRADASLVKDTRFERAVQPQVHLRRLQPDQHHQLRHPRQRGLSKPGLQCLPDCGHDSAATGCLQPPPVGGLGIVTHTIGSPRQIQMSLHAGLLSLFSL